MRENEGVALRAVRWSEIFPWLIIGKSFRLSLGLRLLVFGAAALLFTLSGWWTIASVFSHEKTLNDSWRHAFGDEPVWTVIDRSVPDRPFSGGRFGDDSGLNNPDRSGPLLAAWTTLSRQVLRVFAQGPLSLGDLIAGILSCVWSLAVWAFFGAAIGRVAAVELATGERVGWAAAFRWGRRKWLSYLSAPAVPMVGVALAALPVVVLGLLMRSNFFAALAGLFWPLSLLVAFVMTLLLVGVLLGWPLMWATISVEGTDSFDALSRTYAYVFQKPLRYLFYVVVAVIVGWLGWIVVENFAAAVIYLADWASAWGAGQERIGKLAQGSGDSSLAHAGGGLIAFWNGCVKLLALGYVFSYFGVASTAIYYQLRRDVDARETDEVFLDADQGELGFGLPDLEKDVAGAPELAAAVAPVAVDGAIGNDNVE